MWSKSWCNWNGEQHKPQLQLETSPLLSQQLIEQLTENQQGYSKIQNINNTNRTWDIYRLLQLVTAEYILFQQPTELYSKTDHILGHIEAKSKDI